MTIKGRVNKSRSTRQLSRQKPRLTVATTIDNRSPFELVSRINRDLGSVFSLSELENLLVEVYFVLWLNEIKEFIK